MPELNFSDTESADFVLSNSKFLFLENWKLLQLRIKFSIIGIKNFKNIIREADRNNVTKNSHFVIYSRLRLTTAFQAKKVYY